MYFMLHLLYILAICFPDVIWLGASQVLCVLVQLGAHALLINFSLKDIYNPGLGSTLFLQAPVAIYYIWYVVTRLPEKAGQLWFGIPGAFAAMIICFIAPVFLMKNRKNNYPLQRKKCMAIKKTRFWKSIMTASLPFYRKWGLNNG